MPIYDYVCSSCATRTEFIHGIDAPAPRFCPACGAEDTLRKAFVAPSVHFKGSGWAKKDRSTRAESKSKAAPEAAADGKAAPEAAGEVKAGDGKAAEAKSSGTGTGEPGGGARSEVAGVGSTATGTAAGES